jgi:hypothetical protein
MLKGHIITTRAAMVCLALLATLDASAKAPSNCAPASVAQTDTVNAITDLFTAAQADDDAGFKAHITTDFYAYDGGKRFDGVALWSLIKSLRAAGKKYEWSVTEPEVHLQCDWAWVTYVNKGAVTDASARQEVTWLESAILRYEERHWRVQFLHSTRAAGH